MVDVKQFYLLMLLHQYQQLAINLVLLFQLFLHNIQTCNLMQDLVIMF